MLSCLEKGRVERCINPALGALTRAGAYYCFPEGFFALLFLSALDKTCNIV